MDEAHRGGRVRLDRPPISYSPRQGDGGAERHVVPTGAQRGGIGVGQEAGRVGPAGVVRIKPQNNVASVDAGINISAVYRARARRDKVFDDRAVIDVCVFLRNGVVPHGRKIRANGGGGGDRRGEGAGAGGQSPRGSGGTGRCIRYRIRLGRRGALKRSWRI